MLFKNEFRLFQFRFKPKISSRKLFRSDSSRIRPKINSRKQRIRNHYRHAKQRENQTVMKKKAF